MKKSGPFLLGFLAITISMILLTGCNKTKPMFENPEKLILGEWIEEDNFTYGQLRLIFGENNMYQEFMGSSSSGQWKLIADSLKYIIQNEHISLEHESLPPAFHRITKLDGNEFHYEVIQPDGRVSQRMWRR